MSEVAVAFPNDETSAEVIASRLRAAGIPARVDRGLAITWQVPARGQFTVLVDKRHIGRASKIVEPVRPAGALPAPVLRAAIAVMLTLIAFGVIAIVASSLGR